MREHTIRLLGEELVKEGYTAFICPTSGGCFDIVARRESLLLIKVLENIDGYRKEQAEDLRHIASMLSAKCCLVGEGSAEGRLDDGVLYERHGVVASSLSTFREMFFEKRMPERRKFNRLGVRIDPERMVARRSELELTLDELSKKSGIAKKTLYRYEHGLTLAEESNLKKLERELGDGLARGIDPFAEQEPGKVFELVGFETIETRAAPFQMLGKEKERERKNKVLMGKQADKRTMVKRAETYKRVSGLFQSHSCFLLQSSSAESIGGVPIVLEQELSGMKKARELLKLIEERGE